MGLTEVPTLSPSHDVQRLFGRGDAQKEGSHGRLRRNQAWQVPASMVPGAQSRPDQQTLHSPPDVQSGKRELSFRGWKVMSHLKPIQAPGAEEERCPRWSAPASGGVPQCLGKGREVQGTSLVHANFIWSSWVLGRRGEGRGKRIPFPFCSSMIPECHLGRRHLLPGPGVLRGRFTPGGYSVHSPRVGRGPRGGMVQGGRLRRLLL